MHTREIHTLLKSFGKVFYKSEKVFSETFLAMYLNDSLHKQKSKNNILVGMLFQKFQSFY